MIKKISIDSFDRDFFVSRFKLASSVAVRFKFYTIVCYTKTRLKYPVYGRYRDQSEFIVNNSIQLSGCKV